MKNQGFSLIELLVVIAIAATLMAITHLNFSEMQKKENVKADLVKITTMIRDAQVTCQTQKRAAMIVIGNNTVNASMYFEESVSTPITASLAGVGMPNAPVPDPPIVPLGPNDAPLLITKSVNLSTATQDFTTIKVDRRGYVFSGDNDYSPLAICFSGNAVTVNGNQIRTGKLPEGKDCKPEEVVY